MKCIARVWPTDWRSYQCKHDAKFIYQPPQGDAMPLCGRHSVRYRRKYPERVTGRETGNG